MWEPRQLWTAATARHFRDLFFQPDPPKPLFNAVVRLLAGYWQPPTLTSRIFLEAFYGAVWLHGKFNFVDPVPGVGTATRLSPLPNPLPASGERE